MTDQENKDKRQTIKIKPPNKGVIKSRSLRNIGPGRLPKGMDRVINWGLPQLISLVG